MAIFREMWVNIHGFLEALNVKDRVPEKFIDETNVKVSHEDGYVLRNMTLAASDTMVRERFRINRVINETVFHRWHRNAGFPMDKKQVISVYEDPNSLNTVSVLSWTECGYLEHFQLTSSRRLFRN